MNLRLWLYGYGGHGALELSEIFDDLPTACLFAEGLFEALADDPLRLPYRIDVVDVWTRETVTRLAPHVERDPDVCAACGAPGDPFAASHSGTRDVEHSERGPAGAPSPAGP